MEHNESLTEAAAHDSRNIGLFGATGIGVGAIVGGGILALAGVAFATTGPSAVLAFALNGVIALLTALSFAEMSSRFPESGGTYTFSRKVLSVEAAFFVGWVVWFASVVASVLYAIGFAYFSLVLTSDLLIRIQIEPPPWLSTSLTQTCVAILATTLLALAISMRSSGDSRWANVGKIMVFAVLVVGGFWAVKKRGPAEASAQLRPFFIAGFGGLIQAMGYSFIALQGFDLIAAVGGEIRRPAKTIPRAMILSLTISLAIYLPLLLVIAMVGTTAGQSIAEAAAQDPEGIVPVAARNFLGPAGYGLVIIAAVLSMFTALQANLFAASRIALTMSRDRTLPRLLSRISNRFGTPLNAVLATSLLVSLLILALPDVASAGAASSLIFLVTFAIAHWLAILVRQRSSEDPDSSGNDGSSESSPSTFRAPLFPLVPVLGGLSCLALAVFQGFAVPSAGVIAISWLSLGGLLFLSLFARRARLMDVSSVAANPELVRLRGNTPLVLVPIANPQNAEAMIALADTLVPANVGRVLLQIVVVASRNWNPESDPTPTHKSELVARELLRASSKLGVRCDTLTTVSESPMEEIARVARLHRCESVLLGLTKISNVGDEHPLERLLGQLTTDVVVLRAAKNWQLSETQRILVPVAGHGGHDYLLARLLASLSRRHQKHVTFLRVVSPSTTAKALKRIERELDRMADENTTGYCERRIIRSDDVVATVADQAAHCDLIILGVQRIGPHQKLFGTFTRAIASRTDRPIIVMSRRG